MTMVQSAVETTFLLDHIFSSDGFNAVKQMEQVSNIRNPKGIIGGDSNTRILSRKNFLDTLWLMLVICIQDNEIRALSAATV
ncbi:hypothetical protein KIN20_015070 [Parelaphostrongylus tenuis]|uniref:Uncharacterized protein n=1 Tax=Parelaphostrongylus tenuis TaxID=148309 RepID=A0AAD5MEC9_PARTN|nr:hypothetical protein KIN20_015070 [Parelaphostrongylus tenuis]